FGEPSLAPSTDSRLRRRLTATAGAALLVNVHPGSDLLPSSPRYQSAHEACRRLLPDGGPPGATRSSVPSPALSFRGVEPRSGLWHAGGFLRPQKGRGNNEQAVPCRLVDDGGICRRRGFGGVGGSDEQP